MYRDKSLVIVLNNCSVHVDSKIEQMIETADYFIHYLSSYLSDFNFIELTFSILKIWIWWNYCFIQSAYANFDEFLNSAIKLSHCDQFAHAQFKHADIYIEQRVFDSIHEWIRAYERDIIENAELVKLIEKEADEKKTDKKKTNEKEIKKS